jgi:phosphomannomutase
MSFSWKKLQNGSDIRGVAMPGIEGEEVNLSTNTAEILGKSFGQWMMKNTSIKNEKLTIGIGMDSRLSGPAIKASFSKGLQSQGAKVLDFGLATTPSMFMSTQFEATNCDGAVMITASHLPWNRNGFKFFTTKTGFEKANITELLSIAEKGIFDQIPGGKCTKSDIITPYSEFLIHYIKEKTGMSQPLSGLKIVLDAGNGAGGFFAKKILHPLGADTGGSVYLEPDGNFPNHAPNPEDKAAATSIQNTVLQNKADLGIIFDTDVDRAAVVDKEGNSINRNALIALLSTIVLKEHPGSTIVTDSVTSDGLTKFILAHHGRHLRFKRGYKNVINESIALNARGKESWLAIETSGHAAFKENFFLDDGAFLVAKVLVEVARLAKENKTITSHLDALEQPVEANEFRISIKNSDFKSYGETVIIKLKEFLENQEGWLAEPVNYEGLRVSCDKKNGNGWFLLRLSLHDPVLPLNIESNSTGGVELIASRLRPFFEQFKELNNISLI